MITVLVSIFGLIVGSFLNVVILRHGSTPLAINNTGKSVFKGRSRCFACGHVLEWHELIPLISFFMQKGRCRSCGAFISWQYPIVEFLTAMVFLLIWLKIPSNFQFSIFSFQLLGFGIWYLIFCLLVVISVYDFRTKIIPDRFVYPLIALSIGYAFLFARATFFADAIAAISAAAFFTLLWLISRGRWIGFGDAKLTLGIGFFLGWPLIMVALLAAFWSAALVGVGLVALKGYTRKSEIPFGPFLALSASTAFLIGEKILLWYGGIVL